MNLKELHDEYEVGKGGCDSKIIERWDRLGFIDGIKSDELRNRVALTLENAAQYMLSGNDDEIKDGCNLSTVIFPIIRRMLTHGKDSKKIKQVVEFSQIAGVLKENNLRTLSFYINENPKNKYDKRFAPIFERFIELEGVETNSILSLIEAKFGSSLQHDMNVIAYVLDADYEAELAAHVCDFLQHKIIESQQ